MTNRFTGCVRRRDLADTERQKTFAHERPQPHPIERPDSSLGDKMRRIPRRDERKNAGAPTAVRRSRAGQRGCFAVSGTSERRANPLAGASALQARRGQRRTRSVLTSRCPSMRKRAETFVKNCCGRTQEWTQNREFSQQLRRTSVFSPEIFTHD